MKLIDNRVEKLGNDLKKEIKENSKIRICASNFSMYGYEALKKLSKIQEFKFIFSDPTFVEKIKNENQFNKKVELNKQLNELLMEEKNV